MRHQKCALHYMDIDFLNGTTKMIVTMSLGELQ